MDAGWGIISRVAPDAQLEQEAGKIIQRLAINAPLSLKAMKALIIRELLLEMVSLTKMSMSWWLGHEVAKMQRKESQQG